MSRRRKKVETKPPEKPVNNVSIIPVDPSFSGRFRGIRRNPLDIELESEDAMLARDLKTMRIDEIVLKRRARVAKLQKEIDKLEKDKEKNEKNESAMPGISISMARQISMLPMDEQDKVMQTYAAFRSIDQSKGRGDSLLPLLVGFSKSNPGNTQSDMAMYAKAMADQFKTGIDAMKAVMPKEKASSSTDALKLMKDLIIEGVRNPVLTAIEKSQPQPGLFEQFITNPDLFNRVKELGLFGSREPKAGSTNIDLEIEKLRGERELSIKKIDLEWKRDTLKRDSEDRRTDAIITAIGPISALFSGPLNQRMRQFGLQQASTHNPTSVIPPVGTTPTGHPSSAENSVFIKCSCGYQGLETFQDTIPDKINCPNCGIELNVGAPRDGKPEETDTGTRV